MFATCSIRSQLHVPLQGATQQVERVQDLFLNLLHVELQSSPNHPNVVHENLKLQVGNLVPQLRPLGMCTSHLEVPDFKPRLHLKFQLPPNVYPGRQQ